MYYFEIYLLFVCVFEREVTLVWDFVFHGHQKLKLEQCPLNKGQFIFFFSFLKDYNYQHLPDVPTSETRRSLS